MEAHTVETLDAAYQVFGSFAYTEVQKWIEAGAPAEPFSFHMLFLVLSDNRTYELIAGARWFDGKIRLTIRDESVDVDSTCLEHVPWILLGMVASL